MEGWREQAAEISLSPSCQERPRRPSQRGRYSLWTAFLAPQLRAARPAKSRVSGGGQARSGHPPPSRRRPQPSRPSQPAGDFAFSARPALASPGEQGRARDPASSRRSCCPRREPPRRASRCGCRDPPGGVSVAGLLLLLLPPPRRRRLRAARRPSCLRGSGPAAAAHRRRGAPGR